jgi:AcrR family transcriptional regulator
MRAAGLLSEGQAGGQMTMGRLQEERSAETRKRLLDATVDCLYDRGYAGTTTAEIAARAGVSKGAHLHHFPTKDHLVVSALEYLFDLRLAASRDAEMVKNLPANKSERLAAIIDLLVPVYQGKVFYAWLELVVASRTDVALREAVRRASERFSKNILEIWRELFAGEDPSHLRIVDRFVNGQFFAIALSQVLMAGESDAREAAEIVAELKEVGTFLLRRKQQKRSPS